MFPRTVSCLILAVFIININLLAIQIQDDEFSDLKEELQVISRLMNNITMLNKLNGNVENIWNKYPSFLTGVTNDPNDNSKDFQNFSVKSSVKLGGSWGDTSYRYRKNLTINSMKVTADLQDFPVLIDLYDSDLHLDVRADGDDIRFTDTAGMKLDHELEYFNQTYNSTHAHLIAWVRIPSLSSTINTIISMYYGNDNIGSQENPTGVWDSNYLTVLHFNEAMIDESSGATHYDSTMNNIHGTQNGNDDFAGKICDGQNFDGANDKINIPPNSSLNPSTDVTISGWFKLNNGHLSSSSTSLLLLEKFTSNDQDMAIILTGTDYNQGEDGALVFKIKNGDVMYKWTETRTWSASVWYYFTCVLDANNLANNKIYINGLDDTDSTDWSYGNNTNLSWNADWNIGGGNVDTGQLGNGEAWFNGLIDEVRISSISRSISWILTEYNNQYDSESFYSIRSEEEYFGGSTTGFRTYHGSFQFLSGTESIHDIGGTVDPSQAFLIVYYSGNTSASHPREHQVSGYISSPTQIKFDRVVEDPNVYVSWWIVESPEIYVQRGSISIESGQISNTVSVSMVDPSRSLVIGHSRVNDSSATQQDTKDGFVTVELKDSTTVIAERAGSATGTDAIIRFQIIEWPSKYAIYSGEVVVTSTALVTDLIATSGNPSDPVINMSSSWVYFTYDCTDNGLQQTSIFGQITDTNEVTFGRYDNSSFANRIRWYVVEHPPEKGVNVQRGAYNWDPPNSGTNTLTNDIPYQVDPDRTLIIRSSSTRGTGLSFPLQKNLPRLISGSQWTRTQYHGTTNNDDQHEECWQIISLPPPDNMPPVIHDFGVDDPGNGFSQFWVNVSDSKSNVEMVVLSLNETLNNMTLNETGLWIYQPSSINFNDFFSYQIYNTTDSSGNYLTEGSTVKNITFNYDTVFPNVLDWEYYSYIGSFGTFYANVTDSWGEIDSVLVNVTQCAGIARNDLTATMRPTISGYINDTLQMNTGTILFEIIVTDTAGNSYTSSKHQGEVNIVPIASNLTLSPDPLHSSNTLSLNYDFYDQDGDSEEGTEIRWYKNSVLEPVYNDLKQFPAYALIKGDSWCASVQPKDGKNYGELIWSLNITVCNSAPEISNDNIAPNNPTTDSILSTIYSYYDYDNDDENTINRQIRWYKNGQLVVLINDQISVPPEETTKGETWFFEMCVHDGTNYSNWVTSAIVTITNAAPLAGGLDLAPNNPKTNQDLIASYILVDPDGDQENGTTILWYKNGIEQPAYENQLIIPASATNRGENWYFTVLPSDGIDYGSLKTSPMINTANTAPSASDLSIMPNEPKTGDELIVMYSYSDADSDPESGTEILWYKDGVLQGMLNGSRTVPTSYTAKGQVWHYKVHPKDGIDCGSWVSLSINVTIGNTIPEVVCTSLFPEGSAYTNDTLVAIFEGNDTADNDSLVAYHIVWKKDNIEVPSLENSTTVLPIYTSKGEVWIFEVRVFDGSDWSENKWAGTEIRNSKPYIQNVDISGGSTTSDDFVIFYEFVDIDGDEDETEISWNILHLGTWNISSTVLLPNSLFTAGDYIYCRIIPHDGDEPGESVLEPQSGYFIVGNTPPELVAPPNILGANNCTFYPPGTPLYVNYSAKDIDGEESLDIFDIEVENGLVVHAQYRWYRNGMLVDELQNHYVEARYVTKGDVWIVSVCPRDRQLDHGSWVNSSAIIIGNGCPMATNLKFIGNDDHPQFFVEDQEIKINYTFVVGVSYRKNDLSMLRWYVNGVYQFEYDGRKLITANKTHTGEIWTIEVYPFDGIEDGTKVNISVIIESKPTINDFRSDTDREGYYELRVNASDVRNTISEVCFEIILEGTDEQTKERYKPPWKVEFPLSEEDFASFINTTVIVKITAVSTTQSYENISYKIDCIKYFNFTIKDETPPRVKDTDIKNLEQNPTSINFYAEIQEFGSGVEEVILYYYFKAVNMTEDERVGFGASLRDDKEQKWRIVEMLYDHVENTNGETIQIYDITIPFMQNRTNWKIIYRIKTVDKNGNEKYYDYSEFNEIKINYNSGELIINLDPALITIFTLLIGFSAVVVLIHRYHSRSQAIQLGIIQKYNAMKSIRVIFCRTSFGVQFYNEQPFHDIKADIDILSGLSAAFSDFMKDMTSGMMARSEQEVICEQKTEFEVLSSKDLSVLVWNGIYSSVAIISEKVLPKIFHTYIRHIGQEIEDNFADKLENYISPNQIPVDKVRRIIRKHLPLYYCSPLALNGGVRRMNSNMLSRKEQNMWNIINQKIFSKSNIGYSFPEAIVSELGSSFKRIEAIKFLKKAVKLNLLVELSLPHSVDSSNQPIIAERIEE